MSWSNTGERGWAYRGETPMTSEKDLTIEALEKKLKIKEGIIDLMGQFTEKLQAEIDDLQENSDKKLKEALANSDACWKLEQEMYVRQRDEARAEVERLRLERDEQIAEAAAWRATARDKGYSAREVAKERDDLRDALQWYVDHDDTNEGGRWEESNAGWLEGKRRAQALLGRR